MSNRPSFTGTDIFNALIKKGFQVSNGDHKRLFLYVNGKRTAIRTKISHGRKTYEDFLWNALKKQLFLQGEDQACIDLIKCPLNHEGYVALLTTNGHLQPEEEAPPLTAHSRPRV